MVTASCAGADLQRSRHVPSVLALTAETPEGRCVARAAPNRARKSGATPERRAADGSDAGPDQRGGPRPDWRPERKNPPSVGGFWT